MTLNTYACEYTSEIDECVQANKSGDPRSIEDFVCIDSRIKEDITYQIVLDSSFRKIDEEVKKYFEKLQKNKDTYFWPNASNTFLEAFDDIENSFSVYGYYGKQYADLCKANNEDGIVQQTLACVKNNTASSVGSQYFFSDETSCMRLVATKLSINRQIAYDILKLNKHQVRNDIQKKLQQDQRSKYNTLLESLMVNVGYIERIRKKWPSKTRNAH